ncbi:hypothetical protein KQX54_009803 [Cotesia glomerata]|uniref:Odorant receptor n=1 Tax=Cotesia glomerata TaxID=32391 RepID=A0AAV7J6X9_COTGL|nr:hypothetical protein KQX54_009803 [Cotesia glomerata]
MALGFWPSENPSLPYRLLSYIQLPLNFGMFLAIFNFVRLYAHNMALLTKSFGVMTTYLSTTLKITCFLINRKEALELHRTLDPHFTKLAQERQMKKIIFKKFTSLKLITCYLIFREIIKGLLTSVGFWPRENPSLPYRLLSYIQLPLNFGVFLAIFNFVRLYANNLTILTESFSILGSYLSTSFKVTYFLINRREILELHPGRFPSASL